jgi:hypothetical protein
MSITYRRQSHDIIKPLPVKRVVALKMVWSGLACGLADKLLRSCDTGMASTPELLANTNGPRHVLTRRERNMGEHQHRYR